MVISIMEIMRRFKETADAHPMINAFGTGPRYEILQDIKYYPYVWIIMDNDHTLKFSEANGYRAVEYSFIIRVGDKNNNQINKWKAIGINSNNGQEITSDTFTYMVDILNSIAEDSIGIWPDISLIEDILIRPFFNEDTGDVNGHEAEIILRVKNENPCISPITDGI